jgi:hypothetical protein
MRKIIVCFLWLFLLTNNGYSKQKDNRIPLIWSPTETVRNLDSIDLTVFNDVQFMFKTFQDARKRPDEIGVNIESEDEELIVVTRDNVASWLTDRFKELFVAFDVAVVESDGILVIEAEIIRFFVTEKSTYKGEVELKVRLLSANGDILWDGMASGKATRFGRSFSSENYYEALSNATIYAVHELLRKDDFKSAVKKVLPL